MNKKVVGLMVISALFSGSVLAKNCKDAKEVCQQKGQPQAQHQENKHAKNDKAMPAKAQNEKPKGERSSNAQVGGKYMVNAKRLNVRSEPGRDGKVKGKAEKGQTFTIEAVIDGWAKVIFNGESVWVSVDFLQKVD